MMNSQAIKNRVESSDTDNAYANLVSLITLLSSKPAEDDSKSDTESVASDWQSAKAEQDMAAMKKQITDMALELEKLKAQQAINKAESERKRQADALAHNRELERLKIVQAQQAEAARKAQAQALAHAQAQAQAQAKAQAIAAQQASAKELADILDPQQLQTRLQACNNRGDRKGYLAEMNKYQDAVKRSNLK